MRKVLAQLSGGSGAVGKKAGALLGACLAQEADDAADVNIVTLLARYEDGLPSQAWAALPRCVFFGDLDDVERCMWEQCGVRYSEEVCCVRRRAWCGKKLDACRQPEALPDYVYKQVRALAGLSEPQQEQLMGEMVRQFKDRCERERGDQPGLETVLTVLKAAGPYRKSGHWDDLRGLIVSLAGICRLPQGRGGVDALEEILTAFSPYAGENELAECMRGLFLSQCRNIERNHPVFRSKDVDNTLFQQLSRLEERLPEGVPQAGEILKQLRLEGCKLLLDNPQDFMTSAWLAKQASRCPVGGEDDTGLILRMLADISRQEKKDGALWKEISAGRGKQVRSRVLYEIMPKLFMKKQLPGLSPFFILTFLYKKPDQAENILRQAAEDEDRLLLRTLRFAQRYDLPREPDSEQSFEDLILSTICAGDLETKVKQDKEFAKELQAYYKANRRRG